MKSNPRLVCLLPSAHKKVLRNGNQGLGRLESTVLVSLLTEVPTIYVSNTSKIEVSFSRHKTSAVGPPDCNFDYLYRNF